MVIKVLQIEVGLDGSTRFGHDRLFLYYVRYIH